MKRIKVVNLIIAAAAARPAALESAALAFLALTEPKRLQPPVEEPGPCILRRISSSFQGAAETPAVVKEPRRAGRPAHARPWV